MAFLDAAADAVADVTANRLVPTTAFFLVFLGLLHPVPFELDGVVLTFLPVFFVNDSPTLLDFFFGNITMSLSLLSDLVPILFFRLVICDPAGDRRGPFVVVLLSINEERLRRLGGGVIDLRRSPEYLYPLLESEEFEILLFDLAL